MPKNPIQIGDGTKSKLTWTCAFTDRCLTRVRQIATVGVARAWIATFTVARCKYVQGVSNNVNGQKSGVFAIKTRN
jgi:hypothetical protein